MLELLDNPRGLRSGTIAPALHVKGQVHVATARGALLVEDRRAAALLGLLAVEGSAWSRHVADLLWPAAPDADAMAALEHLRAALACACGVGELVSGRELLHAAPGVRLQIGPTDLELDNLPLDACAPGLLEAHDYDDLPEFRQWLIAARLRLCRVARARLLDLAVDHENDGDLNAALVFAHRALALDRRCEDCVREVMRLHARAGRPGLAIEVYSRSNALMHSRHGIALSTEVRALADAIARGGRATGRFDGPGAGWAV